MDGQERKSNWCGTDELILPETHQCIILSVSPGTPGRPLGRTARAWPLVFNRTLQAPGPLEAFASICQPDKAG